MNMAIWLESEEYWLKYGGNWPNWNEGGELIRRYLDASDEAGIERIKGLAPAMNQSLNKNLMKPDILDKTTTGCVKIEISTGGKILVPLRNVKNIRVLLEKVSDVIGNGWRHRCELFEGSRVLNVRSRIIITDETVLTLSEDIDGYESMFESDIDAGADAESELHLGSSDEEDED